MSGSMYLGAAYFDGDPGELLPAYQRMLEKSGLEALDVHLCITTDAGLTVFDACPTREIYEEFTRSETFLGAIAEAGLPVRGSAVSATSRSRMSGRRSSRERGPVAA